MKWLTKQNIRKWLRIIHRDLGYFVVGITLVYAISGIILNHKKPQIDPAFKTIEHSIMLAPGLSANELSQIFNERFENQYELNRILPGNNNYQLLIKGGSGYYSVETGNLQFEIFKKKPLVFYINKLHNNLKRHWTVPADFYAGALLFLALSGMFIVRGKNSLAGRGKWWVIAGFLLVIIYIWV